MHVRKACLLVMIAVCGMSAFALRAKDGATPKASRLPKLILTPQARLEVSPALTSRDSLTVSFQVEVPSEQKYQRFRCLISANQTGYQLSVPKAQQWMLRRDTLMVLSKVEVTISAPKALAATLTLNFNFQNLDQPKQRSGNATLILINAQGAFPALTDSVTQEASTASSDSSNASASIASDSIAATAAPDSVSRIAAAEESGNVMPWILIGLLLSGFAVMAMLSLLSRKNSREAMERITTMRPAENARSPRDEEHRPASYENFIRRREQAERGEPTSVAPRAEEAEEKSSIPLPVAASAPALALTTTARNNVAETLTLPDLQAALAQLSAVTTEVQKAVGKQFEALQHLTAQVETARLLPPQAASLQSKPRLQFADQNEATPANTAHAALSDLGVKISAAPETSEKYEEIVDALASLAAATKIKTPPVALQALTPKFELLQRLHGGLQTLTEFCRANSTNVSAETVESIARKTLDLRMNYEAWASDQNTKLPLMLARPANGNENTERKMVESLLDGLYETRKLAAQGGLYFERKVAQLIEQDVPKLRAQFSGATAPELRKILDTLA